MFFAKVNALGEMPESEMEKVGLFDTLPDNLTYTLVTPRLMEEAKAYALEHELIKNDYTSTKFDEFLRIAKALQEKEVQVLLFGSLGLEQRLFKDLSPDDIDILIPEIFMADEWEEFKGYVENLGYTLTDLHEHKFSNGKYNVGFAGIEGLSEFAGINTSDIPTTCKRCVTFKLLTTEQYLKVYTESSKDSYRRDKNNNKDLQKITLIKEALKEKH